MGSWSDFEFLQFIFSPGDGRKNFVGINEFCKDSGWYFAAAISSIICFNRNCSNSMVGNGFEVSSSTGGMVGIG